MKLTRIYIAAASLIVAGILSFYLGLPAQAFQPPQVTYQYPLDWRMSVPCRDGVVVRLEGTLHVTFKEMRDASGGFHVTSHANWQGVTGVNESTGEIYRFISSGNGTGNSVHDPAFTSNVLTTGAGVSAGEGIIFYVHNIYHVTQNAQGELSAQFSHQTANCRSEPEAVPEQ